MLLELPDKLVQIVVGPFAEIEATVGKGLTVIDFIATPVHPLPSEIL